MNTVCDIVQEEKIGGRWDPVHGDAYNRGMVIWPVLDFEGNVTEDMKRKAYITWGKYARLRRRLESHFDEEVTEKMLAEKNALMRILFPEDAPYPRRMTYTRAMRRHADTRIAASLNGAQYVAHK